MGCRARKYELREHCEGLPKRYQDRCAEYVGAGYLIAQPGDFPGALRTCATLASPGAKKNCIFRLANVHMPTNFRNNLSEIVRLCGLLEPERNSFCVGAATIGIRFGASGPGNKKKSLCDELKRDELKLKCAKVVATYHESQEHSHHH